MPNDAPLLQRLKNGEQEAFAEFLDRFGPRVQKLARRYAPSTADAEDLTQEIFVDLFASIASFRGEAQLATWIYRVALNHCLRHRENHTREMARCGPGCAGFADGENEPSHDAAGNPEKRAAQSDLKREVASALDDLSDLHREIVILHEMHELTYAQCAEVLDVPVGTVKSRLSNAFSHLRRTLGPYVLESEAGGTS